jgi:iron complex transport system ATP-binding protein
LKNYENILHVSSLSAGYDKTSPVLTTIDFTFSSGLTGIIGVNGCGKSTLLKTISGLLDPLAGEIAYNESNLNKISLHDRAKIISIVLTEKISAPYTSVFDIVAGGRSPYTGLLGKFSNEDISIAEENIRKCGIEHLAQKSCVEISDGEKQRCMIARALTQQTPVIILDEPTSYLDFRARFEIMELLKKISMEENKIILFSSHDLEIVFKTTDYCLVFVERNKLILEKTSDMVNSTVPQQLLSGTNLFFDKNTRSVNYKNS